MFGCDLGFGGCVNGCDDGCDDVIFGRSATGGGGGGGIKSGVELELGLLWAVTGNGATIRSGDGRDTGCDTGCGFGCDDVTVGLCEL